MPSRERRLTRDELLAALDAGWGRFLPTLARLPDEEQTRYARAQGYARAQDLLAHVSAWAEETLAVANAIRQGGMIGEYDVDAFNAQAVERCRSWTRERVEAEFESAHAALAALIAELPAKALDDPNLHGWLVSTVVDHYEEHQPPDAPSLRATS